MPSNSAIASPPSGARSAVRRRADERLLFERYRNEGDAGAREQLVARFLPLARQLARRYKRANEPMEDLEQVASLGLLKAIDRFDLSRETAFSSFAVPTILGELKRYFRDSGWATHVARELQERVMLVTRGTEMLSRELGRSPSIAEIAAGVDRTQEQVLEALEASSAYQALSLERPRDDDDGPTIDGVIGHSDSGYDLVEFGASIRGVVTSLPDRERRMLNMRFIEDMTQSEIAARMGISQMHVSRLLRGVVNDLRAAAAA
jgi:RNA polymerase sigma-B factor